MPHRPFYWQKVEKIVFKSAGRRDPLLNFPLEKIVFSSRSGDEVEKRRGH